MVHGFTQISRILTGNADPCFSVESVKTRVPSGRLALRNKLAWGNCVEFAARFSDYGRMGFLNVF